MNNCKRLLHNRGICVIIPTYNNEGTIVDIVQRTLAMCDDIIVVCDGCTDGTLKLLAGINEITIVSYEKNAGKGKALKQGFLKALAMGFSFAITLDADGQHFPEDIPIFLHANEKHPEALIVGERKFENHYERSRGSKFANSFSNFWFTLQTGLFLSDTQSGYRLYPLKKLNGLSFMTSRYESELELLVFAAWAGRPLIRESINVYYPPANKRVSHFHPVKDFARISLLNTVLCFLAVVYGYPRCLLRILLKTLRTVYSLFAFLITMLIATPVIALYMSIGKKTDEKRLNLHRILQFMSRIVLKSHGIPGVHYSESNAGCETFQRPAIIICNHQSHLDLMPLLIQSPKIVVLTNKWVWNNPFYGYIIRSAEFLPVYQGIDVVMPQLGLLVEKGYNIAIYPEGTRSIDCSIGRFHQGAFKLAQELNLDVIPLILYGAGKVLPKKGYMLNKGVIHLEIDSRITPQKLQTLGPTPKEQASFMRSYYKRRYEEIEEVLIRQQKQ